MVGCKPLDWEVGEGLDSSPAKGSSAPELNPETGWEKLEEKLCWGWKLVALCCGTKVLAGCCCG
jgi:hypothetical protein